MSQPRRIATPISIPTSASAPENSTPPATGNPASASGLVALGKRRRYEAVRPRPAGSFLAAGSSDLSSEYHREAVYELQSALEVLGADIAALKEQNGELKEQNAMLRRRMDALERRLDGEAAQPRLKTQNTRNVGLSQNLRFRLESLEDDGEAWDLSGTFLDHKNQMVTEELVRYVQGLRDFRDFDRGRIILKIKTIFKNQKDASTRSGEKAADLQQLKLQGTRRRKKLQKRLAQLLKFDEELKQEFGPDCRSLLETSLMSDDEDLLDEENVKIGIKVLRPSWRSDKANAFYDKLQKLEIKQKGRDIRQLPRTYGTVEKSLPFGMSDLPDWAISSDQD